MESSVQKIAKSDEEYFHALARQRIASICQQWGYPLPGESLTASTAGGGGGELRTLESAGFPNTRLLRCFFAVTLVTQPLKCAVQCLVQPRDVVEFCRNQVAMSRDGDGRLADMTLKRYSSGHPQRHQLRESLFLGVGNYRRNPTGQCREPRATLSVGLSQVIADNVARYLLGGKRPG